MEKGAIMQLEGIMIHKLNVSMKSVSYYVPKGRKDNQKVISDFLDFAGNDLRDDEKEQIIAGMKRKFQFLDISMRACVNEGEQETSIGMAAKVAKDAIDRAGLRLNDIDLLLFVGVSNPFREPTFSNLIAYQIGLENKEYYDINDTCNGFIKAIDIASMYIEMNHVNNVLIVTCENPDELLREVKGNFHLSSMREIDRYMTLLLSGTAAAAMVIGKNYGEHVIQSYGELRKSKDWDLSIISLPATILPKEIEKQGHIIMQSDGMGIASGVIEMMPEFVLNYLRKEGCEGQDIDHVFSHQMGRNTTYAIMKKLGIDVKKQLPVNEFANMGNLACANIPVSIGIAVEKNILKKGASILLLSSSCGLNVSAVKMIW